MSDGMGKFLALLSAQTKAKGLIHLLRRADFGGAQVEAEQLLTRIEIEIVRRKEPA